MNTFQRLLRHEQGQVTVEIVLIAVLSVAVITLVLKVLEEKEVIKNLTLNPWQNSISGMVENGVWGSPEATRALHPHVFDRHSSVQGKPIR